MQCRRERTTESKKKVATRNLSVLFFNRQINGSLKSTSASTIATIGNSNLKGHFILHQMFTHVFPEKLRKLLRQSIFLGFSKDEKYIVSYEEMYHGEDLNGYYLMGCCCYTVHFWEFSVLNMSWSCSLKLFDSLVPDSWMLKFCQTCPSHCIVLAHRYDAETHYRTFPIDDDNELVIRSTLMKLPERKSGKRPELFSIHSTFLLFGSVEGLMKNSAVPLVLLEKELGFVANNGASLFLLLHTTNANVFSENISLDCSQLQKFALNTEVLKDESISVPPLEAFMSITVNKFASCDDLSKEAAGTFIVQRVFDTERAIFQLLSTSCEQFRRLRDFELKFVDFDEKSGTVTSVVFVIFEQETDSRGMAHTTLLSLSWCYFTGEFNCSFEKSPVLVPSAQWNMLIKECFSRINDDQLSTSFSSSMWLSNLSVLKGRSLKQINSPSGAFALHLSTSDSQ